MSNKKRRLPGRHLVWLGLFIMALALGAPASASAAAPTPADPATDIPAVTTDGRAVAAPDVSSAGIGCGPAHSLVNAHVKVCFAHVGDHVWILDKSADGRSAMAEIYVTLDTRHEKCRNPYGKGQWAQCDYSFGDGHAVSFQGYTLDHEGLINIENDHTGWISECSGSSTHCHTKVPAGYPHATWPTHLKDYCTSSPDSVTTKPARSTSAARAPATTSATTVTRPGFCATQPSGIACSTNATTRFPTQICSPRPAIPAANVTSRRRPTTWWSRTAEPARPPSVSSRRWPVRPGSRAR